MDKIKKGLEMSSLAMGGKEDKGPSTLRVRESAHRSDCLDGRERERGRARALMGVPPPLPPKPPSLPPTCLPATLLSAADVNTFAYSSLMDRCDHASFHIQFNRPR